MNGDIFKYEVFVDVRQYPRYQLGDNIQEYIRAIDQKNYNFQCSVRAALSKHLKYYQLLSTSLAFNTEPQNAGKLLFVTSEDVSFLRELDIVGAVFYKAVFDEHWKLYIDRQL